MRPYRALLTSQVSKPSLMTSRAREPSCAASCSALLCMALKMHDASPALPKSAMPARSVSLSLVNGTTIRRTWANSASWTCVPRGVPSMRRRVAASISLPECSLAAARVDQDLDEGGSLSFERLLLRQFPHRQDLAVVRPIEAPEVFRAELGRLTLPGRDHDRHRDGVARHADRLGRVRAPQRVAPEQFAGGIVGVDAHQSAGKPCSGVEAALIGRRLGPADGAGKGIEVEEDGRDLVRSRHHRDEGFPVENLTASGLDDVHGRALRGQCQESTGEQQGAAHGAHHSAAHPRWSSAFAVASRPRPAAWKRPPRE